MTTTTNLVLTEPTVGADADAWGGELNADLVLIDNEYARTARGDAAYVILSSDRCIGITAALTASRTFTLPAANAVKTGQAIYVIDEGGGVSSTKTLTIARAGADTINSGGTSFRVNFPNAVIVLRSDGTSKWSATVLTPTSSGTWTPSVALATPGTSAFVYTLQSGRYTRIGDMMYLDCELTFTPTIGTGSGTLIFSGLPFSLAGTAQDTGPVQLTSGYVYSGVASPLVMATQGGATLRLLSNGNVVGAANLPDGVAHDIRFSMWCKV